MIFYGRGLACLSVSVNFLFKLLPFNHFIHQVLIWRFSEPEVLTKRLFSCKMIHVKSLLFVKKSSICGHFMLFFFSLFSASLITPFLPPSCLDLAVNRRFIFFFGGGMIFLILVNCEQQVVFLHFIFSSNFLLIEFHY